METLQAWLEPEPGTGASGRFSTHHSAFICIRVVGVGKQVETRAKMNQDSLEKKWKTDLEPQLADNLTAKINIRSNGGAMLNCSINVCKKIEMKIKRAP